MSTEKKDPWFGKEIVITQDVVYVGDGENPKDNPYMQAWAKALKEVYGKKDQEDEEDDD